MRMVLEHGHCHLAHYPQRAFKLSFHLQRWPRPCSLSIMSWLTHCLGSFLGSFRQLVNRKEENYLISRLYQLPIIRGKSHKRRLLRSSVCLMAPRLCRFLEHQCMGGKEDDINIETIMNLAHEAQCHSAAAEDETSSKLLNLTQPLPGSI